MEVVEVGTPPVMVEQDADCPDCGKVHDIEACPECGADIFVGFGLACGGYGFYKVCEDSCGWFWQQREVVTEIEREWLAERTTDTEEAE